MRAVLAGSNNQMLWKNAAHCLGQCQAHRCLFCVLNVSFNIGCTFVVFRYKTTTTSFSTWDELWQSKGQWVHYGTCPVYRTGNTTTPLEPWFLNHLDRNEVINGHHGFSDSKLLPWNVTKRAWGLGVFSAFQARAEAILHTNSLGNK